MFFKRHRSSKVNQKSNATKRRARKSRSQDFTFQRLESKNLLAGIFFDAASGEVTVAGDSTANVGSFVQINPSQYRATLSGSGQMDFAVNEVSKIVFIGYGGDDTFTNATGVEGLLLGHDGDDLLVGGSGTDRINGGSGNDQISGRAGADRLNGGSGDDTIYGGGGDDFVSAGSGVNTVNGDGGADLIFGGDDVDTIDGGHGIDQIFALGGDDILFSGEGGVFGTKGTSQADLILGGAGNDTITGLGGLNVFYGGSGNDTLIGSSTGQNRMHGQGGQDDLTGGAYSDYLAGNNGDDVIKGLGGVDYILPGAGNDDVHGGGGNDKVVLKGNFVDFQVTGTGSSLTVTDTRLIEGMDSVVAAETFRFNDGDRPAESGIVEVVTVQPIIVSNSNGTNTAEFFGNSAQETQIKQLIDDIYYQAGIDVDWLTPTTWNNTFANVGNNGNRPGSDLDQVVNQGDSAGVGNSNPLVIDLYFVEIAAGFGNTSENTANGLAFVDANGITAHVGDALPTFALGRDVVAEVIAHEIAHNLGLEHVHDTNNLMDEGDELNASQIATILASDFTIPV